MRLLHYGLLSILSLTIVGALKAVGIILAIAMVIAPGAIAFLVTRRFGTMLVVATGVAVSASLLGVYVSFFIDSAPAPTIVLVMTVAFVMAFAIVTLRQERSRRSAASEGSRPGRRTGDMGQWSTPGPGGDPGAAPPSQNLSLRR